jgi:hypothetical protein
MLEMAEALNRFADKSGEERWRNLASYVAGISSFVATANQRFCSAMSEFYRLPELGVDGRILERGSGIKCLEDSRKRGKRGRRKKG